MFSPKPPRQARRRLAALGVTLAAGAVIAGLTAPAALAAPAGNDGGVDMNAACASQYSNASTVGFYATGSISIEAGAPHSGTVYDWDCYFVSSDGESEQLGGIDVNKQCVAQYGPGAMAKFTNENDPYSWYCFTP